MRWFVLLEAQGASQDGFDAVDLRKVLSALPDPPAGGLQSDDRYAVQLEVQGPGPVEAVSVAIGRLEAALEKLGLPRWVLVRAEALTEEEFERERLFYDSADSDELWPLQGTTDGGKGRGVEETLLRQVFHDPLTGLPDQGLFRDDLAHAVAAERPVGVRCALLLLDVDALTEVNQRFGSRGGDTVLASIARRVAKEVGSSGGVGRMGGDQFAVLVDVAQVEDACSTASRIIDAVAAPIAVGDVEVRVSVSVGIALAAPGDRGEELLTRATRAVSSAQKRGGGRWEVFSEEMPITDVSRLQAERHSMTAQGHEGYVALLERASASIEKSGTFDDACQAAIHHVCETAGFRLGRLYVPQTNGDLGTVASIRWKATETQGLRSEGPPASTPGLCPDDDLAARALAVGSAVRVRDVTCEPDFVLPEDVNARPVRGAVAVPILVEGRAVGVLEFFANEAAQSCDLLLQVLNSVAAHLASFARRATAETLRDRSESLLQGVLETSWVHLKILEADGKVREQYPVTWPADGSSPPNAIDSVHPDDLAVAVRGWSDALQSPGRHVPFEIRVRSAEGTWQWVKVTANNLLDVPGVRGIVTCALEIDDRKRLEDALNHCQTRLRQVEATTRVGTWQVDLVTGAAEWSDELYRVLGVVPGDAAPGFESLLAVVHPEDRVVVEEHRRALESGVGQHVTFRVCMGRGGVRWTGGHSTAILDKTGRVLALYGTLQEITDPNQSVARPTSDPEKLSRFAGMETWHTTSAVEASHGDGPS